MKYTSLIYVFFFLLLSCVGTVVDVSVEEAKVEVSETTNLKFEGVRDAFSVSNKKIEVYFEGANGGSGDYSYIILVPDYSPIPFMVSEESLRRNYLGLFQYTITLDSSATAKSFSVSVDAQDDTEDDVVVTNKFLNVPMFSNEVTSYTGILGVENLPGVDGLTRLKVLLGNAHKVPSLGGRDDDPIIFEIVAIDADRLLPPDMDSDTLSESDGRYVFTTNWTSTVSEYTLTGLPKNTSFNIRSRVIHRGSTDDLNDVNLRGERNNIIYEATTLDDSAASITFDASSFIVSKGNGEAAKTSVITNWDSPMGVFDHLRIYWAASPTTIDLLSIGSNCTNNGLNVDLSGIYCKRYNADVNAAQITGLTQETLHSFLLVVCANNDCSTRFLYNLASETTSVSLPGFNGIESLRQAHNLNELGRLYLNISPPDLSQSFYDGYIVRFSQDPVTDPTPIEVVEFVSTTTTLGDQSLESYDYQTATNIVVNGIGYSSGNSYCYKVNLFNYDALGVRIEEDNGKFECINNPSIVGPTNDEFTGIEGAQVSTNSIILNWEKPIQGVFEHYEIFYTQLPNFSFNDAITDTTVDFTFNNYRRKTVLWGSGSNPTTIDILNNLSNGTYQIGILTYYAFGNSIIRSELNEAVFTCIVTGGGSSVCTRP